MSENKLPMTNSILGDQSEWSLVHTVKPDVATENHLQSLGFDVNDGLPKFRLNEPGPAALASSIFQQNNMVTDESEQSFVVLGKTSLESIREASMASYMELQEKCASADHTSSISMMSPSEIEENLKIVLDENTKLKETLKQNNTAMKEQFNTITTWQKEVITVCDTHKQKFLETKELMSQLKEQNDQLREKIAKNKSQEPSEVNHMANITDENTDVSSLLKKSNYVSIENIPSLPNFNASHIDNCMKTSSVAPSENEQELQRKLNAVSEDLVQMKIKQSETYKIIEGLEKRYDTDTVLLNQQLNKANKELEAIQQKPDRMDSSELQILVNKCCEKDMELKYLNEIITSLKQQLIKYEENILTPVDELIEINNETSKDKKILQENIDFYNLKLAELRKCFTSQSAQFLQIQKFLKESVDIIQFFENANIISNKDFNKEKITELKEKLHNYRKNLIDEQLHSIDNIQKTIKIQKEFQKILFDYDLVLCELEIIKNDNLKLRTMQEKAAEENAQKLAEIEKYLTEEKKYLDSERANLLEERLNLHMEKKLIIEDKEKIEMAHASLIFEKEKLVEERKSLREERSSLDQQSKLYEAEESSLQKEKKYLQKKVDVLTGQVESLNKELSRAYETLNTLRAENCRMKENEEMLSAFRIQTEMREREFEDMRLAQRNLQDQLQSLSLTNVQLRTDNERLNGQQNELPTGQQNQQTPQHQSRYCSLCAKYIVPGERHGMGICSIEFD